MKAATLDERARRNRAIAALRRECVRYGMAPSTAQRLSVSQLWDWRRQTVKDLMEKPGGRGCL